MNTPPPLYDGDIAVIGLACHYPGRKVEISGWIWVNIRYEAPLLNILLSLLQGLAPQASFGRTYWLNEENSERIDLNDCQKNMLEQVS